MIVPVFSLPLWDRVLGNDPAEPCPWSFGAIGIDLEPSQSLPALSQSRGIVGSDIRTIVGHESDNHRTIGHCPIGQSKTLGFLQSGYIFGNLSLFVWIEYGIYPDR